MTIPPSRAASQAGPSAAELAGQSVYTPGVLKMYDCLVLGLSNRFIWRCPTRHLERMYAEHITANHLDVGVGTGYFLDRCTFPAAAPRIALMDVNENCLKAAAARIARHKPLLLKRNILERISFDGDAFGSIGLCYVLHCLPGCMSQKAVVFDHLRPLLAPGGVIFGATLLSHGVRRNLMARRLMAAYNHRGIFGNGDDSLSGLQSALADRFSTWHVASIGCAALFWAR